MKLHIMSDLHVDVNQTPLKDIPYKEADVLVLAGDIAEGHKAIAVVNALAERYPNVIYVPGNHEYWHENVENLDSDIQTAKADNVHYLYNRSVDIEHVRFVGGCMWSDFINRTTPLQKFDIERGIPDFTYTTSYGNKLTAEWFEKQYKKFIQYFGYSIDFKGEGRKFVNVTHFAPHQNSIHPVYKNHTLTPYFINEIDEIKFEEVDLWIHGHTHHTFDYEVNGCRVICNPYGYKRLGEKNDFNPELIVEI